MTPASVRVGEAITATGSLSGERKTVTALFADIKGAMELLEDPDREEVRACAPALTLMMAAVHRYDRARGPPPFFPE